MNRFHRALLASGIVLLLPFSVQGAGFRSAEVTRVYNQVELLVPAQPALAAKVGDDVSGRTAVQTGGQSRTELQFNDRTIARLGANSIFSFERGTRDLDLNEGVILLEVPKNAGGATINTAAVTAAVTGTTVMIECRKGKKAEQSLYKFLVLEGTMRLNLNNRIGEAVQLHAGQIVVLRGNMNYLPDPQYIDVERLIKTSELMSQRFSSLENEPYILQTVERQRLLKAQGKLLNLNEGQNPMSQTVSAVTALRTDAMGFQSKPSHPPKQVSRPNPHSPTMNRPTVSQRPAVKPSVPKSLPKPFKKPPKSKPPVNSPPANSPSNTRVRA